MTDSSKTLLVGLSTFVGVANSATGADATLHSVTIPPNLLAHDQEGLVFEYSGVFVLTTNINLYLKLGSTTIVSAEGLHPTGGPWILRGRILRSANLGQAVCASLLADSYTLFVNTVDVTKDLSESNDLTLVAHTDAAADVSLTMAIIDVRALSE